MKNRLLLRKNYEEYLKSEEWRRKREHIAQLKKHTCEICKKIILKGFHIHHKTYKNFGFEPDEDLMFLCEDFHTNLHSGLNKKKNNQNKKKNQQKCCKNFKIVEKSEIIVNSC